MLAAAPPPPQSSFATTFLDNKGASSSTSSSSNSSSTPQLSPSVVVIIVLITVVFFLSGFLHLLARCFARPSGGSSGLSRRHNSSGSLVSQGQLQQLFQQHDAGVEQAFIDALPVFFYRSVRGLKDGADCAVCLNEFSGNDRLRLLPKCSHAFHLECIDEWLLSHSTCPLCRCSLLVASDASSASVSAWAGAVRVESLGRSSSIVSGGGSSSGATSFAADSVVADRAAAAAVANAASGEIFVQEQQEQRVVPVKLGRFCPAMVDSPIAAAGSRRSYSMGSYEYVLDASGGQTAVLVIAPTPIHRRWKAPGTPGHRSALSECIPEESSSSPWVTIDIDARPMLKPPPLQQQPGGSSILSWTPWKKSSTSTSTGGDKQSSAAAGGGGASAALQAIKSFSFRLPAAIQQQQQQQPSSEEGGDHHFWWWKNNSSSSRCLSESEQQQQQQHVGGYYGNSSACSQWDQASVCSTNAPSELKSSTGSVASSNTTSIARRTLQWLMGRESRQPRASSEDIPGAHGIIH